MGRIAAACSWRDHARAWGGEPVAQRSSGEVLLLCSSQKSLLSISRQRNKGKVRLAMMSGDEVEEKQEGT